MAINTSGASLVAEKKTTKFSWEIQGSPSIFGVLFWNRAPLPLASRMSTKGFYRAPNGNLGKKVLFFLSKWPFIEAMAMAGGLLLLLLCAKEKQTSDVATRQLFSLLPNTGISSYACDIKTALCFLCMDPHLILLTNLSQYNSPVSLFP